MISERDRVLVNHILDAAEAIEFFVKDIEFVYFLESDLIISAVVKKLEIIGEAANKLSTETKAGIPQLPWRDMVGMRNILIHDYMGIDAESVWDTIKLSVPKLVVELEQYRFHPAEEIAD